jgi:hypothetical protein
LVDVKIAIDDALSNLSAEAIKNRHVQALHVNDVILEAFGHIISFFPSFTKLEVNFVTLFNDNAISAIKMDTKI